MNFQRVNDAAISALIKALRSERRLADRLAKALENPVEDWQMGEYTEKRRLALAHYRRARTRKGRKS